MLPVVSSILSIGTELALNIIIKHPMKSSECFNVRVPSKEERADEVFVDRFLEIKEALLSSLQAAGFSEEVGRFRFVEDAFETYYPDWFHAIGRLVSDLSRRSKQD